MDEIRKVKLYTLNEQEVVIAPMQTYLQHIRYQPLDPYVVFQDPDGDMNLCVETLNIPVQRLTARLKGGVDIDEYLAFEPRVKQIIRDEYEYEIHRLQIKLDQSQLVVESWEEAVNRFHSLPWYKRVWFALKKKL